MLHTSTTITSRHSIKVWSHLLQWPVKNNPGVITKQDMARGCQVLQWYPTTNPSGLPSIAARFVSSPSSSKLTTSASNRPWWHLIYYRFTLTSTFLHSHRISCHCFLHPVTCTCTLYVRTLRFRTRRFSVFSPSTKLMASIKLDFPRIKATIQCTTHFNKSSL